VVKNKSQCFTVEMQTLFTEAMSPLQGLIDTSQAKIVAKALVKSRAFTVNLQLPPEQWFRWKCGIVAPCGCDCRSLNRFPDMRRTIDNALTKAVRSTFPDADYSIAVANAGIPWAKTLAKRLHLPLAYVRSTPKAMGSGHLVECSPRGGQRAIMIEDAVVSGKSTRNAIQAIHGETDVKVFGVQSIVNWNFPSMSALLDGYVLRSFPVPEIHIPSTSQAPTASTSEEQTTVGLANPAAPIS